MIQKTNKTLLAAALIAAVLMAAAPAAEKKPNIVLIVAGTPGCADLPAHGGNGGPVGEKADAVEFRNLRIPAPR